jgi:outer membrane protein
MGQYYQVLYTKGLEQASKMKLAQSESQLFRITKMVETGKEAVSKQFEMQSQVSADQLSYTIAVNTASQAVTTLKQMLRLDPAIEFDVPMPQMDEIVINDEYFDPDSVYQVASEVLPRLKSIEYELKASRKQVAAAYGGISPSITTGASMSTGYFNALSDNNTDKISYHQQIKNNVGQQIYVSLNIPLFNNYSTGRNIRMAKIKRNDTALRLEEEKSTLYTEVENICLNFNRGRDEYSAAQANLEFNRRSFNAIEKKFESGLVDVTVYSAAKTTLFTAETEALRTKLQFMIRKLTIQFYSTGEYEGLVN